MNDENRFAAELEKLGAKSFSTRTERFGRVTRVVGLTVEATGITAEIGAQCVIETSRDEPPIEAEVVGFDGKHLYLMPIHYLEGIKAGSLVRFKQAQSLVGVGESMLGRVINGLGEPIDGKGSISFDAQVALDARAVNPMQRGAVKDTLDTGIKAINGCLTFGKGQRMGVIAGSGVGKSVLMGMLTRNTAADVVVIGLIGERGREVQEFVQRTLGEAGLARAIVVAAPVDVSPVMRIKAAKLTHSIAEYFASKGNDVLLLFDSLTRVAHAQREIGLAVGEPPTTKGYTPSVFSLLPKLIERVGVGPGPQGSISAFYTVLADAAHYPAIDLEGSISRVATNLLTKDQILIAQRLRRYWTLYAQKQDLIQVGAYTEKTDPELDEAIRLKGMINAFLTQDSDEVFDLAQTFSQLKQTMS